MKRDRSGAVFNAHLVGRAVFGGGRGGGKTLKSSDRTKMRRTSGSIDPGVLLRTSGEIRRRRRRRVLRLNDLGRNIGSSLVDQG